MSSSPDDGPMGLALSDQQQIDVAFVDVHLLSMSGIEVWRHPAREHGDGRPPDSRPVAVRLAKPEML